MSRKSADNKGTRIERPLLLVSFFVTNESALSELKKQWSLRSEDHRKMLGREQADVEALRSLDFGGSIALLDPANLTHGIYAEISVPLAFGMCVNEAEKSLFVASGNVLTKVKNGQRVATYENFLFNDIHGLSCTLAGRLLVTSTGTDALLELEFGSPDQVQWDWLATENGYSVRGDGKVRVVSRSTSYRNKVTTTPEHTTHINSALNHRPGKILATLFHQGELVEIDCRTKQSRTVVNGLQCPHAVRKRSEGYLVCDTRRARILLLHEELSIDREIFLPGFDWIQDAVEVRALNGYVVADSNNGRLVLIDRDGRERTCFEYSKHSHKIASLEIVSEEQAEFIFGSILERRS